MERRSIRRGGCLPADPHLFVFPLPFLQSVKQKLEIEKAAEGLARAATGCKVGCVVSPWLLAAGRPVDAVDRSGRQCACAVFAPMLYSIAMVQYTKPLARSFPLVLGRPWPTCPAWKLPSWPPAGWGPTSWTPKPTSEQFVLLQFVCRSCVILCPCSAVCPPDRPPIYMSTCHRRERAGHVCCWSKPP